jgi:hypothetical protein
MLDDIENNGHLPISTLNRLDYQLQKNIEQIYPKGKGETK